LPGGGVPRIGPENWLTYTERAMGRKAGGVGEEMGPAAAGGGAAGVGRSAISPPGAEREAGSVPEMVPKPAEGGAGPSDVRGPSVEGGGPLGALMTPPGKVPDIVLQPSAIKAYEREESGDESAGREAEERGVEVGGKGVGRVQGGEGEGAGDKAGEAASEEPPLDPSTYEIPTLSALLQLRVGLTSSSLQSRASGLFSFLLGLFSFWLVFWWD